MNPSLDQVESSLFVVQKHFENEKKSLQRYVYKPDASQFYIDERNQELANLANSITIIEAYIDISQLLYAYCGKLKRSISFDPELRQANIKVPLREGDPMGKIVLID